MGPPLRRLSYVHPHRSLLPHTLASHCRWCPPKYAGIESACTERPMKQTARSFLRLPLTRSPRYARRQPLLRRPLFHPRRTHRRAVRLTTSTSGRRCDYLASDDLEGRASARPSDWCRPAIMLRILQVAWPATSAGAEGLFSAFQHDDRDRARPASSLVAGEKPEVGSDFCRQPVSLARPVSGPLVFAGYGISSKEHSYDDYESSM